MEEIRKDGSREEQNKMEEMMMPTEQIAYVSSLSELIIGFVDDFVLAAQPRSVEDLRELLRVALHAIYSVFPPA